MLIQITVRTTPAVFGYGSGLAIILAAFNYTGGKLSGFNKDPTVDEVSRKEHMRKNRRKSAEETVQELGEGRGTYSQNPDALTPVFSSTIANHHRHLRPRIQREEGREAQGRLRLRCPRHASLGGPIDLLLVNIPDTQFHQTSKAPLFSAISSTPASEPCSTHAQLSRNASSTFHAPNR